MMKTKILFRPSEIGKLMSNARGKSNLEKYNEAVESLEQKQAEYDELKNKETKKAASLQERIEKLKNQIEVEYSMRNLPNLSEGTKTHLRKKMIEIKFKRYKDIGNKYTTKGNDCEEEAITLYSLLKGRIFENNKERKQNETYSGEIDIPWFNKEKIMTDITDIKNSWDVFTFFDNEDDVKKDNKWQGVGYLDLHPTVQTYRIANMLVNNTDDAILQDLYRESYKWKDGEVPTWKELEIIKGHVYTTAAFEKFIQLRGCGPTDEKAQKVFDSFVEIPAKERMIEHTFSREELNDDILAAKKRMTECRLYLELIYQIKHEA